MEVSGEGTIESKTTNAEYIGFTLPWTTVTAACTSGEAYKFTKVECTAATKTGNALCSAHGKTCTDIYSWYLAGVDATSYAGYNPAQNCGDSINGYSIWPYADLSKYMGEDTVNWWGTSYSVCCQ